jgi:hypothetical protein
MAIRFLYWLGIAACILLIVSCFLPWGYYADIDQTFTGFYSYRNQYGRPGKFISLMASLILVFMLLPRVWAKRANLFMAALLVAYGVTNYIRFGSCYNNYCPERLYGLYLMLASVLVILLAAIFPDMRRKG